MGNSFFGYIQQLELMAFFSGYSLLYAIILVLAGNKESKNKFQNRMVSVLPLSYALVSTLYLGLQLKNLYLSYSSGNIIPPIHHPYLMIWGLLAILFWIPAISKKTIFSLLHSLLFFFLLIKDLFLQMTGLSERYVIGNDMKMYTISILLNTGALIVVFAISYGLHHLRICRKTTN